MGLNVNFSGFVYDENSNLIDAKFQIHYVRQNKWNNVRDTSDSYYSCNTLDNDSLSHDDELKVGDVILLAFWNGDGTGSGLLSVTPNNRESIFDRFCVVAMTYVGTNTDYTFNVQLKPKQIPTAMWDLEENATINNLVIANDSSFDESSWVFQDKQFHHRNSYYSKLIFPEVGKIETTYNWGNNSIYSIDNTHIYTTKGDYNVSIKLVNAWGLETIDTKSIRIKYNPPVGGIIFNPDGTNNKIHTSESVTVKADISDVDNRILSISHNWVVKNRDTLELLSNTTIRHDNTGGVILNHNESSHGVKYINPDGIGAIRFVPVDYDELSPVLVMFFKLNNIIGKVEFPEELLNNEFFIYDGINTYVGVFDSYSSKFTDNDDYNSPILLENGNKLFTYDKTIEVLQKHFAEQTIYWNDGWEDLTITYSKELEITNWLPLVNFDYMFLNNAKIKYVPIANDIDGEIIEWKWELYNHVPFSNDVFTLAKTDMFDVDSELEINFETSGRYKMVLTIKDDYGDTASVAKELFINIQEPVNDKYNIIEDVFFIIPDEYEF